MNGNSSRKTASLRRPRKLVIAIIAAVIALVGITGGTLAYMARTTQGLTNTFTPSQVSCEVTETINGLTKSDVCVHNTSDIPAYIRAAVVINYVDGDGNICANHSAPAAPFTPGEGWTAGADGFYYYGSAVEADASTAALIGSMTLSTEADGCRMQVEIIASAIQAEGADSAAEAWNRADPS